MIYLVLLLVVACAGVALGAGFRDHIARWLDEAGFINRTGPDDDANK